MPRNDKRSVEKPETMNRAKLLALQVAVGVAMLVVWHVLTVYPILGEPKQVQFFFSTPLDVLARVAKEFSTTDIWRHLWITLVETILAFATGAAGGILFGFLFARREMLAMVFDPYIKAANALPRVVLAPIFALWFGLRARHLVQGGARLHARVLHRVLQRLSGRARGQPRGARERPHARHERAPTPAPRLLAGGADLDVFVPPYLGRLRARGRGSGRVSRLLRGPRL